MSRLYHTGFEWQAAATECSAPTGTIETIDTGTYHSGAASLRVSGSLAAGAFAGVGHNMTMATDVYTRVYVRIHVLPNDAGASVFIWDLMTATGAANITSIQIGNESGVYTKHVYYKKFGAELANPATIAV
jgi:hypothetical protein